MNPPGPLTPRERLQVALLLIVGFGGIAIAVWWYR